MNASNEARIEQFLDRNASLRNVPPDELPRILRENSKLRQELEAARLTTESLQNHRNAMQKSWVEEYVKGEKGWLSLGTVGKLLSAKPVEGVVNAIPIVNKVPLLGKLARAAAIGAMIYFGIDVLKRGAQMAYGGGNILLDRIGPGAGHSFPPMDLPPAPYQLQPLPPADPWSSA